MTLFLCDTHVIVWAAATPERLRPETREVLADTSQVALVSSVSVAEMVIKIASGKLSLPLSPMELCERMGFGELTLSWRHAERVHGLAPIHRDPFDRLLIAQAMEEDLTLITADAIVASYKGVRIQRA